VKEHEYTTLRRSPHGAAPAAGKCPVRARPRATSSITIAVINEQAVGSQWIVVTSHTSDRPADSCVVGS
jgi:hypothetical protein